MLIFRIRLPIVGDLYKGNWKRSANTVVLIVAGNVRNVCE